MNFLLDAMIRVLNQNVCLFAHYLELQFQVAEELTELYPYVVVHNVPHQFQEGSFVDKNFCMLLKVDISGWRNLGK